MQIDRKNFNGQALRPCSGQAHLRQGSGGQGTIDMTLVVVVMCAILFAGLKMFVWFNQSLMERQEAYEAGQAYSPPSIHLIQGEQ